jgi:hypothetical protein
VRGNAFLAIWPVGLLDIFQRGPGPRCPVPSQPAADKGVHFAGVSAADIADHAMTIARLLRGASGRGRRHLVPLLLADGG